MATPEGTTTAGPALRRELGPASMTALVVGEMIGVGIFLTPAGMARSLGSPAWLLAAWLTMGVITLAGALCFGELASRFPEAGGGYVYLRHAFGPRVAFLYGWMALMVMDPGLTAMLAVGMADYAGYLAPLTAAGQKALALGAILVLASANALGVRPGAGVLRGLVAVKLGLLALIPLWGFAFRLGDWSNLVPLVARREGSDPLPAALIGALIAAFFSFAGWWDAAKVAGEVRDPARTLPRALGLGVGTVTGVYVLISAAFLYLVPLASVTSDRAFASLAGEALFGRAGGVIFSVVVIASVLGSLAAVILAAPRVYFAMARDGLFLPALARLHPRSGTPILAIALQATLASVLVLTGSFREILGYFFFCAVAFIALMVAGLYLLRRDPAPAAAPTPGYPLTPLVFLVPIAVLLALLGLEDPRRTLIGTATVLLGLPVYEAFRRGKPRDAAAV